MNRYDVCSIWHCLLSMGCCVIAYYSFVLWPHRPQFLGLYPVWWWLALAVLLLIPAYFLMRYADRIRKEGGP